MADCKHHFDMDPDVNSAAVAHHGDGTVTIGAGTCRHCNETAAEIALRALAGTTFEWPDRKLNYRVVNANGEEIA